jgi:hypothetical protein
METSARLLEETAKEDGDEEISDSCYGIDRD